MESRERVESALSHQEPDRVPIDLGGSAVTGMHASTVYNLRQAVHLDPPGTPVKVQEPYQMLGEIKPDLQNILGIDVVALMSPNTMFGYKLTNWKSWTLFDGTPVLVPGGFNTKPNLDGSIFMYPKGNQKVSPVAKMPKDGFYFDSLDRQKKIDWKKLDVLDNLEEFRPIDKHDLQFFKQESKRLYSTGKAILANFGGTSFGDIALVPGLDLEEPRGIRGVKEWYMSHVRRPDYIIEIFERQLEIALENLGKIFSVVDERISAVFITGTDFGSQLKPIISNETYQKLYKPFHFKVNNWIHENTSWRTFIHCCGSIEPLIPEFIEAGFDIINPVQTSAANMDPKDLKNKYGQEITFWGGGVDTQNTLPLGTPEMVEREVRERVRVFGKDGGFVFNTIHNVQPRVPIDNVLSMYRALTTIE
jgi:hypothetical protein